MLVLLSDAHDAPCRSQHAIAHRDAFLAHGRRAASHSPTAPANQPGYRCQPHAPLASSRVHRALDANRFLSPRGASRRDSPHQSEPVPRAVAAGAQLPSSRDALRPRHALQSPPRPRAQAVPQALASLHDGAASQQPDAFLHAGPPRYHHLLPLQPASARPRAHHALSAAYAHREDRKHHVQAQRHHAILVRKYPIALLFLTSRRSASPRSLPSSTRVNRGSRLCNARSAGLDHAGASLPESVLLARVVGALVLHADPQKHPSRAVRQRDHRSGPRSAPLLLSQTLPLQRRAAAQSAARRSASLPLFPSGVRRFLPFRCVLLSHSQ